MDETQEERGASSGQDHQETRKAAWTSLPRTVLQPSSIPDAQDYTFQCDSRVSVGTLHGRISIPYQGYDKHIARIRQGATIGDAKLWYGRQKKQFYLLVSLSIDVSEPTCEQFTEVVGVDAGIRYLAVTSTSTGKAGFHSGKRTRHQANHYARLRKRLQHKGTRGAKSRLRRIEQRERRLKAQANHCIAIQIVKQHPHALIGLEHLTDIRERTKRRKRKRRKNGKGSELVSPKARHPPIACTRNGPLLSYTRSSATRPRFRDRLPSRWMRITPQRPVRCAAIPPMRTAQARGCSLCVRTQDAAIPCMPI
jgi:hypothetical protein